MQNGAPHQGENDACRPDYYAGLLGAGLLGVSVKLISH